MGAVSYGTRTTRQFWTARPRSHKHIFPPHLPRTSASTSTIRPINVGPDAVTIDKKVLAWAAEHGIGFQSELGRVTLGTGSGKYVAARYSRSRTISKFCATNYFATPEHPSARYRLFMLEKRMHDPLWLRTEASFPAKPVVRNFAKRRLREGVFRALAEKGMGPGGQVLDSAEPSVQDRAMRLEGTLWLHIVDTIRFVALTRDECSAIGRDIIEAAMRLQNRAGVTARSSSETT